MEDLALALCSVNFHIGIICVILVWLKWPPCLWTSFLTISAFAQHWTPELSLLSWESLEPGTSLCLLADLCLKYLWAKKVLGSLRIVLFPICFFMQELELPKSAQKTSRMARKDACSVPQAPAQTVMHRCEVMSTVINIFRHTCQIVAEFSCENNLV